ncbi:MAG: hypothetical protein RMJ82_13045 [Gemmatales bacterium]|nr:hypothetical protein [Gemmatales bacterium]
MLAYQWLEQASARWTRLDMLLALLDETIRVLETLAQPEPQEPGREPSPDQERQWQRAELLLAVLISGVNPTLGEVAVACLRTYEYVYHIVRHRKTNQLPSAVNVLATIRSGFEAIRSEANELERQGVIPSLAASSSWGVVA